MIYRGMSAHVRGEFVDAAGAFVDPDGVLFSLRSPGETVQTFTDSAAEVEHVGPGVYVLHTPPLTPEGDWTWQVESTGAQPRITGGVIAVLLDPIASRPEALDAIARLRLMCDSASFPTLTDDELVLVLRGAAIVDRDGLAPSHDEWTPTYALGAAARDAWLAKAGKVANRVTASDGSLSVNRSDLVTHFLTMADRYAAKVMTSVPLTAHPWGGRLAVFNSDAVPIGAHEYGVGPRGAGGVTG